MTVLAILTWLHSAYFATLNIDGIGLILGLPFTYYVAVALLLSAAVIQWKADKPHGWLLATQTVLFIGMLWVIPEMTGGCPPFDDHVFRNLSLLDYIAVQGNYGSGEIGYLSWPGTFILFAPMFNTIAANPEPFMHYGPLVMQILYIVPLYVFLKNMLGQKSGRFCWPGIWLFTLASWTGREYLTSPPGVAMLMLLILMALLTSPGLFTTGRRRAVLWTLVALTFTGLVMTHLLTSLAALAIIGALAVVRKSKLMMMVAALCLVVLLAWNINGMEGQTIKGAFTQDIIAPGETLTSAGEIIIKTPGGEVKYPTANPIVQGRVLVLSPGVVLQTQVAGHIGGNSAHRAVGLTRIWLSGAFVILGIVGAVMAVKQRKERRIALNLLAMSAAPLVLAVIPYGGRGLEHLYVFSLPAMAYFAARLLRDNGAITTALIAAFILISVPFHIIAHYGNQVYDYTPVELVDGLKYVYKRAGVSSTISDEYDWASLMPPGKPFISLDRLEWAGDELLVDTQSWIYIDRRQRAYFSDILGAPSFIPFIEAALAATDNAALVYETSEISLYQVTPKVK